LSVSGERNGNWKGGRSVASNGYVLIRVGVDHHLADVRGYAYEHRLVAEAKLGRRLHRGEIPHHLDGDRENNHPSNLEVVTRAWHGVHHRRGGKVKRLPGERNPWRFCLCGCRRRLRRYDVWKRKRKFITGHNPQSAPTEAAVLSLLKGGAKHRKVLALRTGRTKQAIATSLSKLRAKGKVKRIGFGFWRST
jgi:hypothetical protein